jgi:hypothetical protein
LNVPFVAAAPVLFGAIAAAAELAARIELTADAAAEDAWGISGIDDRVVPIREAPCSWAVAVSAKKAKRKDLDASIVEVGAGWKSKRNEE